MVLMSESSAQSYLDKIRGSNFAMAGLLVGLLVFREIYPYIQAMAMQLFF